MVSREEDHLISPVCKKLLDLSFGISELYHFNLDVLKNKSSKEEEKIRKRYTAKKWEFIADARLHPSGEEDSFNDEWKGILNDSCMNLSGKRVMKRLDFVLNSIPGIKRHEYQIEFHDHMKAALLPKIFGREWFSNSLNIMREYGIKKHHSELIITTPRRFGKTTAIVLFIIAALYAIPCITIAIYSTCKRTAGALMDSVTAFLSNMPDHERLCIKNNSETVIYKFGPFDTRTMKCYPGSVATTKGSGGDLIVVDEGAYIKENLLHETIFPLTALHTAALVILSTPLDETNFLSKMIAYKLPDGNYFFQTVHMSLICSECMKKETPEEMIQCKHEDYKLPHWKSSAKQARLTDISLQFDNAGRGARENFGLVASSQNGSFRRNEIRATFEQEKEENYRGPCIPSFIMMAIDPNAGGDSETAIVSGFFLNEEFNVHVHTSVILGIDAQKCKDHTEQQFLITRHVRNIRQMFPTTRIIVVPENQTGFFHTSVGEYLFGFDEIKILYQGGGDKAGVTKTNAITSRYVQTLVDALRENSIKFYKNWFTLTEPFKSASFSSVGGYSHPAKAIKDKLKDELLRYGYDPEKKKLTGKINGYTDDKAIALMMFVYWGKTVLTAREDNPYVPLLPQQAITAFFLGQFIRKKNFNDARS